MKTKSKPSECIEAIQSIGVEDITVEKIRALSDRIRKLSRRNLSAVEIVLLHHAEQMLVYAGVKYSESGQLDELIIANLQAAKYLAKCVADIK